MTTKLFTGRIRASDSTFLVWATDEIDAGRYVTATLGEPQELHEVPRADGTLVLLDREQEPRRVVTSYAVQNALRGEPTAPPA